MVKVKESILPQLSELINRKLHRCGGFVFHDSIDEAKATLMGFELRNKAKNNRFASYTIDQQELIEPLLSQITEQRVKDVIIELSSFRNRYYQSKTGEASANWIQDFWKKLVNERKDISVELYQHSRWRQPSVILTIKGGTIPDDENNDNTNNTNNPNNIPKDNMSDEIIIIGGHLDSTGSFWGGANARAPGADDNASGIAVITEIIRVILAANYYPSRTIKFMGYAAEEAGLRGSKEIAKNMQNENIIGVLQLDMVNYKGSNLDIFIITDYTNDAQNEFLGRLINEYVKVSWGYDECGYGCSDHASWHNKGFPASIPAEARVNQINPYIHTSRDKINVSGNNANHAVKFAKLALSYLIELDR